MSFYCLCLITGLFVFVLGKKAQEKQSRKKLNFQKPQPRQDHLQNPGEILNACSDPRLPTALCISFGGVGGVDFY